MRNLKVVQTALLTAASLIASAGFFQSAAATASHPKLHRDAEIKIIRELEKPLGDQQIGLRILTDGSTETPDATRPVPVTLPNGEKKFLVGLSGQHVVLVDRLSDLHGGQKTLVDVVLHNENGFTYGGEVNRETGAPVGYAHDSSTWDITVVHAQNADGKGTHMVIFAGAMGNETSGRPQMIRDGMTSRRRVIFHDVNFEPDGRGSYKLVARSPKSPFTKKLPKNGEWVVTDKKGRFLFNHGYGGEPVTLPNGDLFVDERGWVPVIHESVVEERVYLSARGDLRRVPYRTVLAVTYMDPTLNKVMKSAETVLDVFKPDGTIWSAAKRPSLGPLVEGAHIEVQHEGKTVQSMADVKAIREAGGALGFEMLFSAGEYYSHYGSFIAHAAGTVDSFKPVETKAGELYDITEPLKVLFVGTGRPVKYTDENGQKNLLLHGAARSGFREDMELDVPIRKGSDWRFFNRRLLNIPVEDFSVDGQSALRLKDTTGLVDKLSKFTPRSQARERSGEKVRGGKASQAETSADSHVSEKIKSCRGLF